MPNESGRLAMCGPSSTETHLQIGAGTPESVNGRIVAESGEGYEDKHYAIEAAKKFGPRDAVIESED
jgi:hypothetical protein